MSVSRRGWNLGGTQKFDTGTCSELPEQEVAASRCNCHHGNS